MEQKEMAKELVFMALYLKGLAISLRILILVWQYKKDMILRHFNSTQMMYPATGVIISFHSTQRRKDSADSFYYGSGNNWSP